MHMGWLRLLLVLLPQWRECNGITLRCLVLRCCPLIRRIECRKIGLSSCRAARILLVGLILSLLLLHRVILLQVVLIDLCGHRSCSSPLLHISVIEGTSWRHRCRNSIGSLLLLHVARRKHRAGVQLL